MLSALQEIDVDDNQLIGRLPPQWSTLTQMRRVFAYGNALSGRLPWTWSTMQLLRELTLDSNAFEGSIPKVRGGGHDVHLRTKCCESIRVPGLVSC